MDNELKEKKIDGADAPDETNGEPTLTRSQVEKKESPEGKHVNAIPMATYLKEKSKRQELEKKLARLTESNDEDDDVDDDSKKALKYLLSKEQEREENELIKTQKELEKSYSTQQGELFNKDFSEFIKYYPKAETEEIKNYLRYLGDNNPTTPLNVLYKQSPFYTAKDSSVESGVKKVESSEKTLTVDPKQKGDLRIADYKKINYATDEEFQSYLEKKYGAR